MTFTIRDSDISYHNLFRTMTQGVVYQNAAGKIIAANSAAEKILGLTFDQMTGRTSMDPRWKAIHENGSDFSGENHPAMVALKTGETVKDALMGVFNPEKETYRWININAVPEYREGERKPYQVYATFEDITERKRTAEEIRNLAKFPSENPNPVLRVGRDGTILYGNKASTTLLKIWKCQLGRRVPDDWCGFITDNLDFGEYQETEIKHAGRVIALSFTPVSDAGYVNIYGQDITERKRAEAERENLIVELQETLKEVKALRGILPLCSYCKKIRDDQGYWEQVDVYINKHTQADISHSICPACAKEHYPGMDIYEE
jgi:PAS domain S-box-containing protein